MPRRQNTGPGPKSKTATNKHSSFLGDSTATEASDAESFQSAELEANHTDYGFDYTTSNVSAHTSRRKSPRKTAPAKEPGNRLSSKPMSSLSTQNTRTPSQVPPPQIKTKKPRKQLNPIQRERKLWKEMRKLQQRTDNLTPKAPFGRLIRELLIQESDSAQRITVAALEALQTSSEIYISNLFADAYVCTLHRGRVTLGVHDLRLVRFLRGTSDAGNKK